MEKVIVQVPASTSNLGPGFDCLGVALALHNCVTIRRTRRPKPGAPLVDQVASLFFQRARVRPFPFAAAIDDHVPRARGLGSSATARVGLLVGLNELSKAPLSRDQIFDLAAQLEGHPDNAAPAVFGGFTVVRSRLGDGHFPVQRFNISPRLSFVLLIPESEVQTSRARKILPARVSRLAAVENVAHACTITAAFVSRRYDCLSGSFADHLHQPFRTKLNPLLPGVVRAAEKAGAFGAFLSGSGSTICAITLENEDHVAAVMRRAAGKVPVRTIVTRSDNHGARVRKFRIGNRK